MAKRRIWRVAIWLGGIVAVLLSALGGLYFEFTARFNPDPPNATYPKPTNALEAQRQDLDYYRRMMALDGAFSPAARAEAERRLNALAASNVALDRAHFRVALLRITALADNGHTSLYSRKPIRPLMLPIRFSDFSDGLYVMRVRRENADLLGARILKIDGRPVEEVLTKLEGLRGGTEAFRRGYALIALYSSEILYGADVAPAPDRSTWTFVARDGRTVERTFQAYQPAYEEPQPDLWRWMSPAPIKDDKDQWVAFSPPGLKLPLTLQDADRTFRRIRLRDICSMVIQLKANEDTNGDSIGDFLKATEDDLQADKPCTIIFDNRWNGGGDYTNTAGFAGRLHGMVRPGGHIDILTSPDTFSAGITTTVFVKQAAAPGQITILGEPVGDRLTFWAEGNRGCLPNAPFCFHYAAGKHDYAHRCTDWRTCYWVNWFYPARTDTLEPDERITETFADYLSGRDPVFDRAAALAKRQAR
jgi:hypothetical protein